MEGLTSDSLYCCKNIVNLIYMFPIEVKTIIESVTKSAEAMWQENDVGLYQYLFVETDTIRKWYNIVYLRLGEYEHVTAVTTV